MFCVQQCVTTRRLRSLGNKWFMAFFYFDFSLSELMETAHPTLFAFLQ